MQMEVKMLALKSNKIKFIAAILLLSLSFVGAQAKASSCLGKNFSMKISDDIALGDVLNQLSDMCDFSIVAKDNLSKQELKDHVFGVNIRNMSLNEVFDLLLNEKNLSYELY